MRGVLGIFFPLRGVPGTKMFENPCSRLCEKAIYTCKNEYTLSVMVFNDPEMLKMAAQKYHFS